MGIKSIDEEIRAAHETENRYKCMVADELGDVCLKFRIMVFSFLIWHLMRLSDT